MRDLFLCSSLSICMNCCLPAACLKVRVSGVAQLRFAELHSECMPVQLNWVKRVAGTKNKPEWSWETGNCMWGFMQPETNFSNIFILFLLLVAQKYSVNPCTEPVLPGLLIALQILNSCYYSYIKLSNDIFWNISVRDFPAETNPWLNCPPLVKGSEHFQIPARVEFGFC